MLVMNKGYQTTYSFQCIELNVNVHATLLQTVSVIFVDGSGVFEKGTTSVRLPRGHIKCLTNL